MRLTKTKGIVWSLMISVIMLASPMWVLAENPGMTPNIDQIKQVKHLQNQNTIVKHLKTNSVQANASVEQERMLRLSRALTTASQEKVPRLDKNYRMNWNRKDIQIPQTPQMGSRAINYGSGVLSDHPDSLYFNFLTGMNSSDSIGMDVQITGNEGTNFGNENASWGDPSLLHFFSDIGTLEDVMIAPLLTDPVWTTVSWDWVNGNNGVPLAVGNLWVVYARTSHMYVALEITNVDTWGSYFEFDYMIQDDGSNIFGEMPPSLFNMTVNGLPADTLEIGSTPYFEITLDTAPMYEVMVFWDANHNGLLEPDDVPIEWYELSDNDGTDEDPAVGIVGFTFTDEMADGLNYLADDLLFVVNSGMDMGVTPVQFYSNPGPFSVSGTAWIDLEGTFEPLPGIVVWASNDMDEHPAIIGITDEFGSYHLDLPEPGLVVVGSEDHLYATDGLVPTPPMHEVMIIGHETGFDFLYETPTNVIQGYVVDETGASLVDVEVVAHTVGPSFSAYTDEEGFYSMGVMPGWYVVEIDWLSLPQAYMIPFGEDIMVEDNQIYNLDITLQTTNSMISGTVLVDGAPWSDVVVWGAHPEFGYSATYSNPDGSYILPVLDLENTPYDVGAFIEEMPNIVPVSENRDVLAGTTGENILFETLNGGLYGYFIDGTTGTAIENAWEVGMSLYDINTGMEFWANPHPDGSYEVWVPNGQYEILAGGMNWFMDDSTFVTVDGAMIEYDVVLWPVGFDTFFEGNVYDNLGSPIVNAEVFIGNESWGANTQTDESGFFHFDAPYDYYGAGVMAEGFFEQYEQIDLTDGPVFHDFYLEPFEVNGAITGIVIDAAGLPVMDANVYIFSEELMTDLYTDPSGEFWFDVPNGEYDLYVEHNDFIPFWADDINVQNDTTSIEAVMLMPDGGIEGYIRDAISGEYITNADIALFSLLDSMAYWSYTDEDGYYHIPAMNGTYDLVVNAYGYTPFIGSEIMIQDTWIQLDINLEENEFAMAPEINYIIDQPFDQGRQVRMQFWPGGTEWGPYAGFSIWRMTNTPMGEIFDFVDYLPNHDFGAYDLVLPTLVDSSAFTPNPMDYMSLFMVTGHFDMYGYIDGLPDAGYSVDNIVPGIPGTLVLLSTGEDGVVIGWDASMADDFQYFEIYRATNSTFDDALVFASVEPEFMDADVAVGQTYYYMVSAIDANGNASEGTNPVTTSIVSIHDTDGMPTSFGLSQNYPNPFNPTTSIEFALPEASSVTLEIYNLLGQKVRTLVNGHTPAGYISTNWNGLDQNGQELSSGTYIYRLETSDMSFAKKMVLMK